MLKILVHGFLGDMGSIVTKTIQKHDKVQLSAGVDIRESKQSVPFPTFTDISKLDMPVDVVVDFSSPEAIDSLVTYCTTNKLPMVIGTTGLSEVQKNLLIEASKEIPIIYTPNMAIGLSLIATIAEQISKPLYELGFDMEIVEFHNSKTNTPSETSLYLAEALSKNLPNDTTCVFERNVPDQKREKNEIGIHSVRGGNLPGEHEIIFAGADEVITLKHQALSKDVYALGAVAAALFIRLQIPGLYSMHDVFSNMHVE